MAFMFWIGLIDGDEDLEGGVGMEVRNSLGVDDWGWGGRDRIKWELEKVVLR